jgi:HEAT repeat protein
LEDSECWHAARYLPCGVAKAVICIAAGVASLQILNQKRREAGVCPAKSHELSVLGQHIEESGHMNVFTNMRLRSKNPQTRREAVETLAESGSLRAVESLVAALGDPDALVRRAAAKAFNSINDERAVAALSSSLSDQSAEVRATAASALGRQGNLSVIPPLVRALRDVKSRVRASAAGSLRKLGWKPDNDDDRVRFEIALGNPRNAARAGGLAVEALTNELSRDTSFHRRAVAEALRDMNDPRALEALLQVAVSDPDITVRVAAIYSLGGSNDPRVTVALEAGLAAGDTHVRLAAVQVLAACADKSQAARFVGLLKDKHFDVRLVAVKFLASLHDVNYADKLLTLMLDPDKDVREAVARAMGQMQHRPATEPLILALIDEESSVREASSRALDQIDAHWSSTDAARRARARLEMSAHDDRGWVRSAALVLLAKLDLMRRGVPVPA